MSNYSTLKTSIDANIRKNGRQLISGTVLNSVLNAMVNALGAGYQFVGVANEDTKSGTPDSNVLYIAGPGEYPGIGNGFSIEEGNLGFITYDGTWEATEIEVGSPNVVQYVEQTLTEAQKRQARENISALGEDSLYVKKTWAELKTLRDEGNLVEGTWYRITDYVTTTSQSETRSANHPFDILVLATDSDTLSEEAKAIQHAEDGYFDGSNLNGWKLSYCIDNDDTRFAWADTENGKGVIWWMRDEYGNEAPYDFKNIQFKRYKITGFTSSFKGNDDLKAVLLYSEENPFFYGAKDSSDNDRPNGAELSTEFAWVYTFTGVDTSSNHDEPVYYDMSTFHKSLSAETIQAMEDDGSGADTEDKVYGNMIKSFHEEYFADDNYFLGRQVLNNVVFFGHYYDNGYDDGFQVSSCYANTFGNDCYGNTFGNYCYYNTFGNYCYGNTFGNSCSNNTFGNNCYGNTFGNNCYGNTFGNSCSNNTFGNSCSNNTFGNNCYYNTFGNYCSNNTFGNYCYGNTFGNNCQNGTVFEGVGYVNVPGSGSPIQYFAILSGTRGTSNSNRLTINFVANKNYPQFAGKNTSGTLKIWNPADLVE